MLQKSHNKLKISIVLILYIFLVTNNCFGSENKYATILGFSYQHNSTKSRNVQMFVSGISRTIYTYPYKNLEFSIEGELFNGYRTNESNGYLIAIQPIICTTYKLSNYFKPHIKLIPGISYNNMNIKGMGIDFNFVSSVGVGVSWSGWITIPLIFEYRLIHLSNASLNEQNEGLTLHSFFLGSKF